MAFTTTTNFQLAPRKAKTTELGINMLIDKELRASGVTVSDESRAVIRAGIEKEYDGDYDVSYIRFLIHRDRHTLPTEPKKLRVIPRTVSVEEMQSMFKTILSANPWIADTEKNGELIAATFLDSEAMSPKRNLQDMVKAFEICKDKLDRTPPPAPPKPVYDEGPLKPLSDGSTPLPLDTPEWKMRSASVSSEQMRDLTARLRRYEAWKKQNEK